MRKYIILGVFVVLGLSGGALYAVHPGSPTSSTTAQTQVTIAPQAAPEQTTVTAAAPVPASLWSASVLMEVERTTHAKPLQAFSNTTTLKVGRKLTDHVSLRLDLPISNTFVADDKKRGIDQYCTLSDPALVVSKSNLLDVWGVKGVGDLRFYLPLPTMSRRNGDNRNPHNGNYRYTLVLSKDIAQWSFSVAQAALYFNHRRLLNNEGKNNLRWAMVNEVAVGYKLNDMVTINSLVDFKNNATRKSYDAIGSSLLWINGLDVTPVTNLTLSPLIILKAPDQTILKYFQDDDSRIANTSFELDISYKFL